MFFNLTNARISFMDGHELWECRACISRIDLNAAIMVAVFENSSSCGSVEFIPPGGGTALARN